MAAEEVEEVEEVAEVAEEVVAEAWMRRIPILVDLLPVQRFVAVIAMETAFGLLRPGG